MAINNNKLVLLLVFVIGISLTGGIVEAQEKRCHPANYMTCPTTGSLKLNPACNCLFTPEGGCTFYLGTGKTMECPPVNRPCPLILILSDYMTCSYTGDIQLKPADNCCVAPKGCSLHSYNASSPICTRSSSFV